MKATGRPERVHVYFRHRGSAGESFRLLLSETADAEQDALARALETVRGLQSAFPDHEYLLLIVKRSQGNGG
ncbi:MAG: hypothetical protein ACREAA_01865 [Candidatus Polarisedimenticolia bacterium]